MDNKELLHYAVKGIQTEIETVEQKVQRGEKVFYKMSRGEQVNTTKSKDEILKTIQEYQAKLNKLIIKRDYFLFNEMMADEDKKTETRENNVIKVALSSILSKDTEHLGNMFLDEMTEILNKLALKPYCERIGKRYDILTEEDKEIIAEMQLNDYIEQGEKIAAEIENELLDGESV